MNIDDTYRQLQRYGSENHSMGVLGNGGYKISIVRPVEVRI